MSRVRKELLSRAFRWGQLIAGIECARASLLNARRAGDLLPEPHRKQLADAYELIAAAEQAAWSIKDEP